MLNRFGSIISIISGVGMLGLGAAGSNLGDIFSGVGACTMAVALWQLADLRSRMIRLENCLLKPEPPKRKATHA